MVMKTICDSIFGHVPGNMICIAFYAHDWKHLPDEKHNSIPMQIQIKGSR